MFDKRSEFLVREGRLFRQVRSDFFIGSGVEVKIEFEGQAISHHGNYLLGCKAGPGLAMSNLFHEMGHLAEREIPKLLKRPSFGWGYYQGPVPFPELSPRPEPDNDKPVQREKRCFAYQLSLGRHYSLKENPSDLASLCRWLEAWPFYLHKAVSREERARLGYDGTELLAIQTLAKEIDELSRTSFAFKRFKEAWQHRIIALRESKKAHKEMVSC